MLKPVGRPMTTKQSSDATEAGRSVISTCLGRVPLVSKRIATRAAKRRKGRHAYRCPHCRYWHVSGARDYR